MDKVSTFCRVWKGGGGGGGGLDLESRAKFPYIHESRTFFFSDFTNLMKLTSGFALRPLLLAIS